MNVLEKFINITLQPVVQAQSSFFKSSASLKMQLKTLWTIQSLHLMYPSPWHYCERQEEGGSKTPQLSPRALPSVWPTSKGYSTPLQSTHIFKKGMFHPTDSIPVNQVPNDSSKQVLIDSLTTAYSWALNFGNWFLQEKYITSQSKWYHHLLIRWLSPLYFWVMCQCLRHQHTVSSFAQVSLLATCMTF